MRRVFFGAVLLGGVVLCTACATGRTVGIDDDYRRQTLTSVAVWPFHSEDSFSLTDDARDRVLRSSQTRATQWFGERIGSVTSPKALTDRLARDGDNSGADSSMDELDVPLRHRYNPENRPRPSQAARRLMDWHEAGELSERFVLFGRVIYHTETLCRLRADDHAPRATVQVHPDAPNQMPRPCIVTHLRMKLVDARRGTTVWYNEGLREYHVPSITPDRVRTNAHRLVDRLLGDPDGLTDLLEN